MNIKRSIVIKSNSKTGLKWGKNNHLCGDDIMQRNIAYRSIISKETYF